MAIYHLEFEILKRSEGKSSCYLIAYNMRARIKDERTGDIWDYSSRNDLDYHEVLLPQNCDQKYANSDFLWNHIESIEKRKDSQLCKYFNLAIPVELSREEKIQLVKDYCYENFTKKNIVCDISFHDLDSNNPHAHVMTTLRPLDQNGFGKKIRDFKDKELIFEHRKSWADLSNKYLKKYNKKISHKSLSDEKKENEELAEQAFKDNDFVKSISHMIIAESLDREPLVRIHRKLWRTEQAQLQRKNERDIADKKLESVYDFAQTYIDLKKVAKERNSFSTFRAWIMNSLRDIFDNMRNVNKKTVSYNKQAFKFMTAEQRAEQKLQNESKSLSIASREDLVSKLSKHITPSEKTAENGLQEVTENKDKIKPQ